MREPILSYTTTTHTQKTRSIMVNSPRKCSYHHCEKEQHTETKTEQDVFNGNNQNQIETLS